MIFYIIGYPFSGKTTFAQRIANRTGGVFVDLDEIIYNNYGKSIITKCGEEYFRSKEHSTLIEVTETYEKSTKNVFISCGGGTPCFFDNIQFMLKNGMVIYLKTPIDEIIRRMIKTGLNSRPLLQKHEEKGDLIEFVLNQYREREVEYNKANIILNYDKDFDIKWTQLEFYWNQGA